jgi:hypothetical protein
MSGYAYDYSLSPARPAGWHSALTTGVAIIAVVAVSTISGAVVTLELIASPNPRADSPLVATVAPPASQNPIKNPAKSPTTGSATASPIKSAAASVRAIAPPRVAAPRETASVAVPAPAQKQAAAQIVAQNQSQVQSEPPLTVASVPADAPPTVVPIPQAAPTRLPAASADSPVPDRDLTFAKGYAQRQAAQKAAAQDAKVGAKVATLNQFGRAAVSPPKPRVVAHVDPRLDPRRTREEGFWSDRFDFERHQALAFGDPRQSQSRRAPRAAGPFGTFDRLF